MSVVSVGGQVIKKEIEKTGNFLIYSSFVMFFFFPQTFMNEIASLLEAVDSVLPVFFRIKRMSMKGDARLEVVNENSTPVEQSNFELLLVIFNPE